MTVIITHELILQIRDDAELTAMARVIEGAHRDAQWQGFGSDWDQARVSAYELRKAGFGLIADTAPDATAVTEEEVQATAPTQACDLPEDERHTV